jgi:hypothetical protein
LQERIGRFAPAAATVVFASIANPFAPASHAVKTFNSRLHQG